jgi:prefoldin subunit 5
MDKEKKAMQTQIEDSRREIDALKKLIEDMKKESEKSPIALVRVSHSNLFV